MDTLKTAKSNEEDLRHGKDSFLCFYKLKLSVVNIQLRQGFQVHCCTVCCYSIYLSKLRNIETSTKTCYIAQIDYGDRRKPSDEADFCPGTMGTLLDQWRNCADVGDLCLAPTS